MVLIRTCFPKSGGLIFLVLFTMHECGDLLPTLWECENPYLPFMIIGAPNLNLSQVKVWRLCNREW